MESDFLIVGSGIAGLTFAIDVVNYGSVAVITKKETAETNTNYAQGGIAAAISFSDSIESHIQDTLSVGEGLSKFEAVKLIANEAPSVINELSELGVKFTKDSKGKFDLGQEGGHSARRIVHTKDMTGKEIESTLIKVAKQRGVNLFEDYIGIDLILKNNRCIGVWVLDEKKDTIFPFFGKIVLLATGGIGNIYLHTTNPSIATGDGIAMAYRAGIPIVNMEFVQFHPTSFYKKKIGNRALLLSEAIRGEGGIIKTQDGYPFMKKYDARGDLAPRDIVARAIHLELKSRGEEFVLLDVTHLPQEKIKNRFPNIYEACCSLGVNPLTQPIPVVPAAHYLCGGIGVNIDGKTNIQGVFAVGECACTGVHGANRLASNSLLESIVFAHRAAKCSINEIRKIDPLLPHKFPSQSRKDICDSSKISEYLFKIKKLMWNKVGIVRNNRELKEAKEIMSKYKREIEHLYNTHRLTSPLIELRNIVTTGLLIIECAIRRKESRGLHYNIDYPAKDDLHYKKDTILKI
jgi:L-aspartate oxidase